MSELTYIPTEAPSRPFAIGDVVEVLTRDHRVVGEQTISIVGARRIKTSCGRSWTLGGEWTNDGGRTGYPFPSIRLKNTGNAEVKPS
jgi:hypothetical protein